MSSVETVIHPETTWNEAGPAEANIVPARPNGKPPATRADLATLLTSRPKLAAALCEAQKRVRPVPKDSTNAHHKYKYSSADAIIAEARHALADTGLTILPVELTIDGYEREGENRFELVRKLLLLHTSGECIPITLHWPVCPDRGRPLDKAAAAADTLSQCYYLRDLLLMDRVDPADDVSGRDDSGGQRQAPQPQKRPATDAPRSGAELHSWLAMFERQLVTKGLCAAGDLTKHVAGLAASTNQPADPRQWPAQSVPLAVQSAKEFARARRDAKAAPAPQPNGAAPPAGKASRDQLDRIGLLRRQLKWDESDLAELYAQYGFDGEDEVTALSASEIISYMTDQTKAKA